jgi:hypothetical protein
MIAIHPQYLPLAKLLNDRLFRIPEYQRAYSWTSTERRDLFSDIKKTQSKGPDAGHFMAAMVCLRRKKEILGTDEYQVMEVVDGQQRLTTLIILLKSIVLALNNKDKAEKKIAIELDDLLVKTETDELLLLQTNHDSSHYFVNYLRNGIAPPSEEAKTLADKELLNAIDDCRGFVEEWQKDKHGLSSLVALLKNRLHFLLHEIEDEKSVYTVFEVLNSRGLDVSWLDRLKSILMGAAFELKASASGAVVSELHAIWRDIYSTIGLRQGMSTEALRFAATLWSEDAPNRPLGEKDSVNIFRDSAVNAKGIRDVAHWLLKVTQACNTVTANPRMNAVTRIAQARLLATAIYLRDDIKGKQREALLARWEKVSFRIYGMLGNDARKRVGDYVRLAWSVVNEKLSVKAIDAAIGDIGKDFPIDEAVEALLNTNCYDGWENELRYFMFRYEEHLARENGQNFSNEQWEKIWMVSPSESIEHIWAKSKASEKSKHRLGNLVLLPPRLNSKLQDDDPKDKAEAYRKTGLLIAGAVSDAISTGNRWNAKMIAERESALLEWAKTEWAD